LELAEKISDPDTLKRYKSNGVQLVNKPETQTINGGAWTIVPLKYQLQSQQRQVDLVSYAYVMTANFFVETFAGDHYCKALSPFRALEWIYVDSQYAKV
jgi:hypothetical protein